MTDIDKHWCLNIIKNKKMVKFLRSNLPSKPSPDSSGSPLLCIGKGDAAATADSGT